MPYTSDATESARAHARELVAQCELTPERVRKLVLKLMVEPPEPEPEPEHVDRETLYNRFRAQHRRHRAVGRMHW